MSPKFLEAIALSILGAIAFTFRLKTAVPDQIN